MKTLLTYRAKKRLFQKAAGAVSNLDDMRCTAGSYMDYIKARQESEDWFEIVNVLGLREELMQYKAKMRENEIIL